MLPWEEYFKQMDPRRSSSQLRSSKACVKSNLPSKQKYMETSNAFLWENFDGEGRQWEPVNNSLWTSKQLGCNSRSLIAQKPPDFVCQPATENGHVDGSNNFYTKACIRSNEESVPFDVIVSKDGVDTSSENSSSSHTASRNEDILDGPIFVMKDLDCLSEKPRSLDNLVIMPLLTPTGNWCENEDVLYEEKSLGNCRNNLNLEKHECEIDVPSKIQGPTRLDENGRTVPNDRVRNLKDNEGTSQNGRMCCTAEDFNKPRDLERRESWCAKSLPASVLQSEQQKLFQTVGCGFPNIRNNIELERLHSIELQFEQEPNLGKNSKDKSAAERDKVSYPIGWANFDKVLASDNESRRAFNLAENIAEFKVLCHKGVQTKSPSKKRKSHHRKKYAKMQLLVKNDSSSSERVQGGCYKPRGYACRCVSNHLRQHCNHSDHLKKCRVTSGCSELKSKVCKLHKDVDSLLRKIENSHPSCNAVKRDNQRMCENHRSLQVVINSLTSMLTLFTLSCNDCISGSSSKQFREAEQARCINKNYGVERLTKRRNPLSFSDDFVEVSLENMDVVDGHSCSTCGACRLEDSEIANDKKGHKPKPKVSKLSTEIKDPCSSRNRRFSAPKQGAPRRPNSRVNFTASTSDYTSFNSKCQSSSEFESNSSCLNSPKRTARCSKSPRFEAQTGDRDTNNLNKVNSRSYVKSMASSIDSSAKKFEALQKRFPSPYPDCPIRDRPVYVKREQCMTPVTQRSSRTCKNSKDYSCRRSCANRPNNSSESEPSYPVVPNFSTLWDNPS